MKILLLFSTVFFLFLWRPRYLLFLWIIGSPFLSNLIDIPKDNPFFGSYRIVDYVGYASGPLKQFIQLIDFDRSVLLLLFISALRDNYSFTSMNANKMQMWLGIFSAVVLFSALSSHNILNGLRKAIDTFGLCYAAFYIGKVFFADPAHNRLLITATLLLGLLLGITCFVEYQKFGEWNLAKYGDAHRVTGPFRYWETLGMTISVIIFVLIYYCLLNLTSPINRKCKLIGIFFGVLLLWCVFRTQTRTIMGALTIGLIVTLFAARGKILNDRIFKFIFSATCGGTLVLMISPAIIENTRFYRETINRTVTTDGRRETYIAAQRMFLRHPILGIGLKNFEDDMQYYVNRDEIQFSSLENTSCHSSYFVIAAELGLLGLLSFGCFIWYSYASCRQAIQCSQSNSDLAWSISLIGMMTTFFLCGLTFDPFFDPTLQNWLFCLCLGATGARLERLASPENKQQMTADSACAGDFRCA